MSYRMPAEWEPHEATWLAWPHEASDWPGKFETVRWVYAEIARWLSQVERVRILVRDKAARAEARKVCRKSGVNLNAVDFHICPTNRSWTRDFAPIFVYDADDRVTISNWRFNGWAKYPNHQRDNAAPDFIAKTLRIPQVKLDDIVLEGGSIDVNGDGLLLTTEECQLSTVQARNPGLGRHELEAIFAHFLGIKRVIWLKRGISGDDTHGHVDDIARFVHRHTVVAAVEPDKADANHEPLQENLRILRRQPAMKVVELPMPSPIYFDGQRLPASYANFYIANELVLVPVFNDPHDGEAIAILKRLFPRRQVVPIYCRDFVLGLGTLHCCTQQQPAQ